MSTITLTRREFNRLKIIHGALLDEDNIEDANALAKLISSYKDILDFKVQETNAIIEGESHLEVVDELLYCSECPFKMGYDYIQDFGAAHYVWNTALTSPDILLKCIAHHFIHRESQEKLETFFWDACVKYCGGKKDNLFLHIEGDNVGEVKEALYKVAQQFDGKSGASFRDNSAWYTTYAPRVN